ncbi:MotA/TolQ/ExbB proton channel family protein [Teredinibacter purpureus]|uniref:MotA/TolQ/ExbB proton channel family protein n=1 Tax=Teredinibacter purpureus TaxID=2731756 RepID=UPI0005F861BE|nr:MotA/TolQ/ExbB proton channel family protein [Teredinibacter purpureus]
MSISNAVLIRILGFVVAILWLVLLSFGLPNTMEEGNLAGFSWHQFLIATDDPMYPLNVQVLMWIAFFYCLSEVAIKWMGQMEQSQWLGEFSLFRNPSSVNVYTPKGEMRVDLDSNEALKPELLAAIFYAKRKALHPNALITSIFKKVNHQFQSTNDVGDVYSVVNASLELELHKVDIGYTVIRYLAWLIPTLGFIGTVIGVALALGKAASMGSTDPRLLEEVIPRLGTAFYTTLLSLLLSAIVMILIQIVQAKEEALVNKIGSFCMDNIVTNLKPRAH